MYGDTGFQRGRNSPRSSWGTFRGHRSFEVVKKRWIIERSIAWMTFQRRLNRDYELLPETTEAWVILTFIRLMIRRLAQLTVQPEPNQVAA